MKPKHSRCDRAALAIAAALALGVMQSARGGTFTNPTPIMIPAAGTGAPTGAPAAPYPSVITVAGIPATEFITGLTVTLLDFSHVFPDDVDVLLEGPNGVRVLLMSDTGASFGVDSIDLTFADGAGPLPDAAAITAGTYSPTNYNTPDPFPAPAPAGAFASMLAAFGGVQPNGNWSLYVVDDAEFDVGQIGGGWSMNITTVATTCGNSTIQPGEDCDDGNLIAGDGCGPTCLFEECGNGFVDPGEGCDDGNLTSGDGCSATCVAEFCGDGVVQVGQGEMCDDGNMMPGDGCGPTCLVEVCGNAFVDPGEDCDDGNTVPCDGCDACNAVGPPFCNQTPINIPQPPNAPLQPAPAAPYPSTITVTSVPDGHVVSGLTVTLKGFSHTNPDDVDVLLVGPDGTDVFLMSDVGGSTDVSGIDLTIADGSPPLPDNTVITAGTYAPTNSGMPDQPFPAPAPAEPYGSTLAAFIGSNPIGEWKLFVLDDLANFLNGTFAGGWVLNLVTAFAQCGDGMVQPGETCDDGNTTGGDGCSAMCGTEICGNGIVDTGEGCDDGNTVPCDGCHNCAGEPAPVCGNGVTECGEDCDDANAVETDGCISNCTQGAAIPPPPGNITIAVNSFQPTHTSLSISAAGTPTITSTISVFIDDPYIWDVNVTTLLTHTACGDLDITLTSPNGTSVTLTSDNASGFQNVYNGTVFDDQADPGNPVPYLQASSKLVTDTLYTQGVRKAFLTPEEPLAAFKGRNPNGDWTLTVSDDSNGNGGDLLLWELQIATLGLVPTEADFAATHGPALFIGPGQGVVTDEITITGATGSIGDVNVFTNITHTLAADIDMSVTHPDGTSVTLVTDNGGPNDDVFAGTIWDDQADPGNPAPYPQPNPNSNLVGDTAYANLVVETMLVPEEPLSAFNGKDPNGTWTLTIFDDASPNGGMLHEWSLTITTNSSEEPGPTGDLDEDGDVDLKDVQRFTNCFGQIVSPDDDCAPADLNDDGDVDGADFQVMLQNFTGPNVP